MSDFERELREARERQRREEEARRRAQQEEIRQFNLSLQIEDRKRREAMRKDYERYVVPVKSQVDGLMQDLARQTWGRGGYARYFKDVSLEHVEGHKPPGVWTGGLATWVVGRTETIGYNLWRTENRWYWHASFNIGDDWYRTEYFSVLMEKSGQGARFNVGRSVPTSGTDERELRELLKQEFLKGPSCVSRSEPRIKQGG